MKVVLQYFRPSGKWYSEGEYQTEKKGLFEIWEEVREMQDKGNLPGLVPGAREFHISIDVPEHPHRHPHLILLPIDYGEEAKEALRQIKQIIQIL